LAATRSTKKWGFGRAAPYPVDHSHSNAQPQPHIHTMSSALASCSAVATPVARSNGAATRYAHTRTATRARVTKLISFIPNNCRLTRHAYVAAHNTPLLCF
jgi:hypothetical protein